VCQHKSTQVHHPGSAVRSGGPTRGPVHNSVIRIVLRTWGGVNSSTPPRVRNTVLRTDHRTGQQIGPPDRSTDLGWSELKSTQGQHPGSGARSAGPTGGPVRSSVLRTMLRTRGGVKSNPLKDSTQGPQHGPQDRPLSHTLYWTPLGFLIHIKRRTNDDRFPLSLWEVLFCSTLGVPIPSLIDPSHQCVCHTFHYDSFRDHLQTCQVTSDTHI
jgi:hypothetical protein